MDCGGFKKIKPMFGPNDRVSFKGRSTNTYEFQAFNYGDKLPADVAAYAVAEIIFTDAVMSRKNIIFADAVDDLARALENHPDADKFKQRQANCVLVLRVPSPDAGKAILFDLGFLKQL